MIPSGSASVEMLAIMIAANSTIVGKKTPDSRGATARRSGRFVGMVPPQAASLLPVMLMSATIGGEFGSA
jgi:hypothetical protein